MKSSRAFAMRFASVLSLLVAANFIAPVSAQDAADVKAAYTKTETRIVMRDGAKLFTSIYTPKDAAQKYPILLIRTPYSVSPYGPDDYKTTIGPSPLFQKEGYIFVYQDVRGRMMSEGDFKWMTPYKPKKTSPTDVDEATDTYDTIEWLVKNIPNN
ncbi:MAG TPA: CocE/NonD family hydrolase, partial [Blastocatellia bacterium]|nr:CocE/NonD family hydrolase [Blastocatellia bacterium]